MQGTFFLRYTGREPEGFRSAKFITLIFSYSVKTHIVDTDGRRKFLRMLAMCGYTPDTAINRLLETAKMVQTPEWLRNILETTINYFWHQLLIARAVSKDLYENEMHFCSDMAFEKIIIHKRISQRLPWWFPGATYLYPSECIPLHICTHSSHCTGRRGKFCPFRLRTSAKLEWLMWKYFLVGLCR